MDSLTACHLKNNFPIMVVGPDTDERAELIAKLLSKHIFENRTPIVVSADRGETNPVVRDALMEFTSQHYTKFGPPSRDDLEYDSCAEDGVWGVVLLHDMNREISKSHDLTRLYIDDCIEHYNLTPIFVSEDLFEDDGSLAKIILHCGYIFLFGNDGDTVEKVQEEIEKLSHALYPDVSHKCVRRQFVRSYMDMCGTDSEDKDDYNRESDESHMFIDRTRDDNRLKVFKKRYFSCGVRPPYIQKLPEVKDSKREGWVSQFWYRLSDNYSPNPQEGMIYTKSTAIKLPGDFDTDRKWHMTVVQTKTVQDVHRLADYIRNKEGTDIVEKRCLLKFLLSDVACNRPKLASEVEFILDNAMP